MLTVSPVFLTGAIMRLTNGPGKDTPGEIAIACVGIPILMIGMALVDRQPRNWKMHLSTAVILMFTASTLLWLNLRVRSGWPVDARKISHYWTASGSEVFES